MITFRSEAFSSVPLPPELSFEQAFNKLDPKSNSIYILEFDQESYVQCGGGQSACSVEVRQADANGIHRRYAIGRDQLAKDPVRVVMSIGGVWVQKGEVLTVADAAQIFQCLYVGLQLPDAYTLRDLQVDPVLPPLDQDEPIESTTRERPSVSDCETFLGVLAATTACAELFHQVRACVINNLTLAGFAVSGQPHSQVRSQSPRTFGCDRLMVFDPRTNMTYAIYLSLSLGAGLPAGAYFYLVLSALEQAHDGNSSEKNIMGRPALKVTLGAVPVQTLTVSNIKDQSTQLEVVRGLGFGIKETKPHEDRTRMQKFCEGFSEYAAQ